jgi:localization factor PodJL
VTASLIVPQTLPSLTPAPQAPEGDPVQSLLNSVDAGSLSLLLSPPLLSAPSTGPAPSAKGDVTGTIARTPADNRTARPAAPVAQPSAADGLPTAIGGARLRNAASAGDPAAAYEVAMRFMEGRGVPANLEEAAKWLERAASKGLVPAQFRYASMLEKGQGVRKDLGAAQKLYVAAAAKGHAKAMHNLAVLYAEGVDGKPDYANAVLWFRKAADYGVTDSQFNLALLVARGLGTEKNIAESYKWFALAAAQGDRDAVRKREDAAAALDASTLAAAQEAVKNFAVQVQPTAATAVPEPSGGWDRAAPPPQDKPRAAGPLSLSAVASGKQ